MVIKNNVWFLFVVEPVTACKGRGIVLDECKRECDCIDGEMKNCFRIRKEFTTLPNEEKKRYLQAYYKITTEEPLKTRFIPFISKHAKWFWKGLLIVLDSPSNKFPTQQFWPPLH